MQPTYQYYREALKGIQMPYAFVDIDLFDRNIKDILRRAGNKKIRIASKSIRCVHLMRYIFEKSKQFQGIMCFTAEEAIFLSAKGFDDLLVAYPSWNEDTIKRVAQAVSAGKQIILMTDSEKHLLHLNKIASEFKVTLPICLDLDMSTSFPGIHFGVYRSSINSVKKAKKFLLAVKKYPSIQLVGLMGYEAQIAGVGDNVKGSLVKSQVIRRLKKNSIPQIVERRKDVVNLIEEMGFGLSFVNGGGTGSLESTREEEVVTEITVGSGFYNPTLFDNYQNFKHLPTTAYAIEIVRKPKKNYYTCLGGGYTASGAPDKDKFPQIYLPQDAKLTANEWAGEVQTPVVYKGPENIKLGDPIFLRHSKAGELCERFNHLHLLSKGKVVKKVPTYRGEGMCFL